MRGARAGSQEHFDRRDLDHVRVSEIMVGRVRLWLQMTWVAFCALKAAPPDVFSERQSTPRGRSVACIRTAGSGSFYV